MFVGCVKNCFRNIGERPTEIRRKAGGDSPKSQRRFAERTTEIRRKAERMKTTNHHPVLTPGNKKKNADVKASFSPETH